MVRLPPWLSLTSPAQSFPSLHMQHSAMPSGGLGLFLALLLVALGKLFNFSRPQFPHL